jgi:hypothetical protein
LHSLWGFFSGKVMVPHESSARVMRRFQMGALAGIEEFNKILATRDNGNFICYNMYCSLMAAVGR